jgi:hypothetical protein
MQLTLMVTVDSGLSHGPIRMAVLTLLWSTLAFCSKWDGSMRYECSDYTAVGLTFMNIFMRVYRGNSNHYRGHLGFVAPSPDALAGLFVGLVLLVGSLRT